MAVQRYLIGVFFLVGVVTGILVSFVASNYGQDYYTLLSPRGTSQPAAYSSITTDSPRAFTSEENATVVFRSPTSHEEVAKIPIPEKVIEFQDELHHHDNTEIADVLYNKVRVLCWIMTSPETLDSKAKHVKATWGKRCNKLVFVSDHEDVDFPTIKIEVEHGRDHLTAKTMAAFDYIYKNYLDEADWFLKADDDTYVIVENLRYLLSSHQPTEPVYFGHHFKVIVNQGYFSGGGGYVMSKEALQRFGRRKKGICSADQGAEDVEFGRCMEKLQVKTGDSRDSLGRSRFHCFDAATFIHGGFPDWYRQYDKYGAKQGLGTISDYAITFHYISFEVMYNLEFFIYHLKPYGVISGIQDLNRNDTKRYITTPSPP